MTSSGIPQPRKKRYFFWPPAPGEPQNTNRQINDQHDYGNRAHYKNKSGENSHYLVAADQAVALCPGHLIDIGYSSESIMLPTERGVRPA